MTPLEKSTCAFLCLSSPPNMFKDKRSGVKLSNRDDFHLWNQLETCEMICHVIFLSGRSLREKQWHVQFSIVFGEFNKLTSNKCVTRLKKKKKKTQGYCSSLINERTVTTSNLKGGERELFLKGESMERAL